MGSDSKPKPIEEGADIHALLAGELELFEREDAVGTGDVDETAIVGMELTNGFGRLGHTFADDARAEHLDRREAREGGPGSGIGREAAHQVVQAAHGLVEMQFAGLLEDLGCRTQFVDASRCLQVVEERRLIDGGHTAEVAIGFEQEIDGASDQSLAHLHHAIVQRTHILFGANRERLLEDDAARVDLMVEEEGGGSRDAVAIDDCPVEGSSPTILREQRGMEVERAHAGHCPNHFGQHPESDDNLQVGLPGTQGFEERLVLELFGLEEREIVVERILLDRAVLHLVASSGRLVGHRDDANHMIAARHQRIEGGHRKIGRAHEYDSYILSLHIRLVEKLRQRYAFCAKFPNNDKRKAYPLA